LATALGRKLLASSTFKRTGSGGICCMTPCMLSKAQLQQFQVAAHTATIHDCRTPCSISLLAHSCAQLHHCLCVQQMND
jgi:hypothetical protein